MEALRSLHKNNTSGLALLHENVLDRNDILDFEEALKKAPGAVFGDNDLCPLKHTFSDGIYVREMFMPKGVAATGGIHKHEHPYFLLKGEVTVITENEGRKTIKAPCSLISPAGTKRVIYSHEDTVWITVHLNPDNITDPEKLREMIISEDYSDYNKYLQSAASEKLLNQIKSSKTESIDNCGLVALKNLSELKVTSVYSLINIARDNGLKLYPYKVPVAKLSSVPFPAIFHTENHFVYVDSKEEFDKKLKYTGNVLLTKKTQFSKISISKQKEILGSTGVVTAAIVTASSGLLSLGIGYAKQQAANNAPKTKCEQDCVDKCKSTHPGLLFSGRKKCENDCKAGCDLLSATLPTPSSNAKTYYIIAGVLLFIAILFVLYRIISYKK